MEISAGGPGQMTSHALGSLRLASETWDLRVLQAGLEAQFRIRFLGASESWKVDTRLLAFVLLAGFCRFFASRFLRRGTLYRTPRNT